MDKNLLGPISATPDLNDFDPVLVLRRLVGEKPKARTVKVVGKRLAKFIERRMPFTDGYIYNVLAVPPRQPVGKPLRIALRCYWMAQNGAYPPIVGAYEPIITNAIPGRVERGSFILAESRRCKNPHCMAPFVPKVWNQVNCCNECKREGRKFK